MLRFVIIHNLSRSSQTGIRARYCASFFCRLRGLTFRSRLNLDESLLLVQRRDSRLEAAIHMLFVGMNIAVIWINSDLRVVDKIMAQRWRPAYIPNWPARYVLETHSSRLDDFQIGDKVEMTDA